MGKGLLAWWRRRIVARGLAGAALFAVPVAVAALIGFGTGFSGVAGGLSSITSGPDAVPTSAQTGPAKLNRAVVALASKQTSSSSAPGTTNNGGGGGGSTGTSGSTGTGTGTATGTSNGTSGGSGGGSSGTQVPTVSTPSLPEVNLPGGGGGSGGAGDAVNGATNVVNGAVNNVVGGVNNTLNGLLGGH
jgi:hypothetical protein